MTTAVPYSSHQPNDEWLEVTPGERFKIRTSVDETSGVYTVLEVVAEPRNGVPMHVHAHEDEHFVVLEGTLHIANGDERLDVPAGHAVTVYKGVAHAWCNLSNVPVRMLIIFSPGDIEEMFRQVGNRESNDLAAVAACAERFGTVIVGPALGEGIYSIASPRR